MYSFCVTFSFIHSFMLNLFVFFFSFLPPFPHFLSSSCSINHVLCVAPPPGATETYHRIYVLSTGPANGNSCRLSRTSTLSAATRRWIQSDPSYWTTSKLVPSRLSPTSKVLVCDCLQLFVSSAEAASSEICSRPAEKHVPPSLNFFCQAPSSKWSVCVSLLKLSSTFCV